ncbi:YfjI family protein [Acidiphilium acidophilum]|uniref:YfjI family protein n=1 Tax=Acidiphilium acidophilum TaxID=76588 RepID=A0AAW9DN88_ACIAO|nr:YfjI family protein [Acidiphilium acidophilum]MDX5930508.1 YfjI family protein [Acidiphilium acidophilum]
MDNFADGAEAFVKSAVHGTPADRKQPLYRPSAPPADYPMAALLELRPAVEAIKHRTQTPEALIAGSVLAAAGFCVAPHHDVEIPGVGTKPLNLAVLTIAQSGERKTTVDLLATASLRRAEQKLAAKYGDEIAIYKREKAAFEAATAEAKKAAKRGRAAVAEALAGVGTEPKPPAAPILMAEESTIEGLIVALIERPNVSMFSAEAGMFLGGHGFTPETATRTMTTVNSLWDGAAIKRLRATGHVHKMGRRSSMSLMAQRSVAMKLIGDDGARDNGLLARILLSEPETTIGTRLWREGRADYDQFLCQYDDRLADLLDRKPPLLEGGDGFDPAPIAFHIEAERHMIAFYNQTEAALRDGERYASIRGYGAKMLEHASRLAGVMAAYAGQDTIDATTFDAGAELATFYAGEHLRLADTAGIAADLILAQRLLEWWQSRPDPRCYLLEIYQRGPNAIREAATAKRIVEILEERGWIERLPAGTQIDGATRRDAWELTP